MKVSIIMPAYNEEKRIGKTLNLYSEYFENLRKMKKLYYELLIVVNNTKDNTLEVVKKYQKLNPRIKYMNLIKGGKGYAVIEGFKDALSRKDNDLIGFVDADGATPPEAFYDLVNSIGNAGGIIASRYIKGARLYPKMNFRRSIVGKVFHALVRLLFAFPFKDTQCGAKIFNRKAIEIIINNVGMTQWAFDIEMLYEVRKRGIKILEIPTIWKEVEGSKLKIIRTSIQMFLAILQLRIIKSKFRRLLKPLGFIIVALWRMIK